jgi:hypothetical protein
MPLSKVFCMLSRNCCSALSIDLEILLGLIEFMFFGGREIICKLEHEQVLEQL